MRVREISGGVFVLFHCHADPATPVEAVHDAVDALERSVRRAFPEARRVVGHAEPAADGGRLALTVALREEIAKTRRRRSRPARRNRLLPSGRDFHDAAGLRVFTGDR